MSRYFAAIVAVVLLAGCAGVQPTEHAGAVVDSLGSEAARLGSACTDPGYGPEPEPEYRPLPADFAAVSVSRCVQAFVAVPGDGEWMAIDEQTVTSGLAPLVDALRKPSAEGGATYCTLQMRQVVILTLADASGKTIVPKVPVTICSDPLHEVVSAIEALTWTTVKQTKIRQVRSPLEIESGCSGSVKPVVALEATNPDPKTVAAPVPHPRPAALKICRYALNPADTMMGFDNKESYAVGALTSAGEITGPKMNAFLDALAKAGPAKACTAPQAPFAIVSAGAWIGVELGGCYRATGDMGGLFQLDAAAVALISG